MDNENKADQLPEGTDQEDLETLREWGEALEQSGRGTLLLVAGEWLCYGLAALGVLFLFMIHKTYPFSVLNALFANDAVYNGAGARNFNFLLIALYGCYLLIPTALALLGFFSRVARVAFGAAITNGLRGVPLRAVTRWPITSTRSPA